MELQSDIVDSDCVIVDQFHTKDHRNTKKLLTGMEIAYRELDLAHFIQGKTVARLRDENALLREQLTEFQESHMKRSADRRRSVLKSYKKTYEEAPAYDNKTNEIKISCDFVGVEEPEDDYGLDLE